MKPIIHNDTEIMILGSYPGVWSESSGKYYHNPGNQFWKLMGIPNGLDYDRKLEILSKRKIGLWDVFSKVERIGSSDKKISMKVVNDFGLFKKYKKIKLVCFNGKTAEKGGKIRVENLGYETKTLLSSSGANNRKSIERQSQWLELFKKKIKYKNI